MSTDSYAANEIGNGDDQPPSALPADIKHEQEDDEQPEDEEEEEEEFDFEDTDDGYIRPYGTISRCLCLVDEQARPFVVRPLYYTNRPVKKPASRAYRVCAALMAFSLFLRGLGVVAIVAALLSSGVRPTYGKGITEMMLVLAPFWLDSLLICPCVLWSAVAMATNMSRLGRHSREWFVGIVMWLSELLACLYLQFSGVWDANVAAYSLLFPATALFICAAVVLIRDCTAHDAPTRGIRCCGGLSAWIWSRWPDRWDSSLLPTDKGGLPRGGGPFALVPLFSLDESDDSDECPSREMDEIEVVVVEPIAKTPQLPPESVPPVPPTPPPALPPRRTIGNTFGPMY